ncbi:hypothetical protein Rhopal_004056-T1 [Rhodotorula paludigena]|uniref:W2 domain-containing protein n=1 Tax=Rhodotorula paludigena TaxID=86838 RepID=A0AAV5GF44_9BASI|nr:hypothetical protein Rhopal_004056-T1 [Rhodotorula paludigena]
MFSAPTPPPAGTKPSLQGVHIKQRKGQAKASAKFEPLVFRDQLLNHLSSCPPADYESISAKLDALGSQLDYRKYDEALFQILLVGAVLAPGGTPVEDATGRCAFSIATTGADADKVDLAEMKKAAGVFERLMRRYKYLQHEFAENYLKQILGYAGKFAPIEQERLAVATAYFVQLDLVPANVVGAVKTDWNVKNGIAQPFLLNFFKTFPLIKEPLEPVLNSFRKAGLADLDSFFPTSKRSPADVAAALKAHGAAAVADWYLKSKTSQVRDEVNKKVKVLIVEKADPDEVLATLEPIQRRAVPSVISEGDFVSLVFHALVSRVNLNAESPAVVDEAVAQVKDYAPVLEPFTQRAVSEVALVNTIQVWCHENPKLAPGFLRLLKTLVGADVLSTGPLVYWFQKGSKPQGREQLLAKAAPLIKFLQEQEDDESDEDDE